MKKLFVLSVVLCITVFTATFSISQSDGKQTRDVNDFTKVNFGVAGNLYISFGSEFKVVLEGNNAILDNIETEVTGGRLNIRKDNWRLNMNDGITVYITMPALDALSVSGSGKAEIKNPLKADNLDLNVSGSGKVYSTDINVSKLDCSISGSGDIILGGTGIVSQCDISISGSGSYSGENLKIGSAEVTISGSGNCSCYVTESLEAMVSGSGKVTYQGDPKIDARISGSGRVRSK